MIGVAWGGMPFNTMGGPGFTCMHNVQLVCGWSSEHAVMPCTKLYHIVANRPGSPGTHPELPYLSHPATEL